MNGVRVFEGDADKGILLLVLNAVRKMQGNLDPCQKLHLKDLGRY